MPHLTVPSRKRRRLNNQPTSKKNDKQLINDLLQTIEKQRISIENLEATIVLLRNDIQELQNKVNNSIDDDNQQCNRNGRNIKKPREREIHAPNGMDSSDEDDTTGSLNNFIVTDSNSDWSDSKDYLPVDTESSSESKKEAHFQKKPNTENPTNKKTVITNSEDKCAICLNTFTETDEIKVLDCGHKFHSFELNIWFQQSETCPMCRRQQ